MQKLLKNSWIRNLVATLIFGALYALLVFLVEGYVEVDKLVISMGIYFLTMCFVNFIESKFR